MNGFNLKVNCHFTDTSSAVIQGSATVSLLYLLRKESMCEGVSTTHNKGQKCKF